MPPEGMRRSSRIPREIAILLVGSDMEGKMFSEQTKTVLLSQHGAGIVSQYVLSAEQDLWGVKFPSMTDSEKEASRVLLQCSGCKAREVVQHSDLESDVYLVNEGIVRFCKRCGSSTIWKQATDDSSGEPVPPETPPPEADEIMEPVEAGRLTPPDPAPVQQPEARPENRRKHVRTKVNFKACIRSYTFGDDIVTCEDISRGGLRFKSRKEYVANTDIEVAAPYSPGMQSIFVRGQIVHVMELKQERRFRCGVAYAKSGVRAARGDSGAPSRGR